jgi:hypothetical protein
MSLSETVMLFILGFATATFFALIIGRLAWKLAFRLGAKRNQKSIPSTVAELQSDRDRLRAEHAMMAAKLEVRLDEMNMRGAEQAAEVSRNRNRVETLAQELAARDEALRQRDAELIERQVELDSFRAQVKTLEREIEYQASQLADGQTREKLREAEMAVPRAAQVHPLTPAAGAAGTESTAPDRLQSRIKELTSLSEQISKQREVEAPPPGVPMENTVFVKPSGGTGFQTLAQPEILPEPSPLQLQDELTRFDEAWQETPPAAPAPTATEKPRRAVTNVIALAQRIKALHKTITN